MTKTLREYQYKAFRHLTSALLDGNNGCLVAPTGSGKNDYRFCYFIVSAKPEPETQTKKC